MPGGVAAKPTVIRKLEGDLSKGRATSITNKHEPRPQLGELHPPKWLLKEGGSALSYWLRDAGEHQRVGTLTVMDREAFALRCHFLARWHRLNEEILVEGESIENKGRMVRNPKTLVQQDMYKNYADLARRFGETPADRTKIGVQNEEEQGGGLMEFIGVG